MATMAAIWGQFLREGMATSSNRIAAMVSMTIHRVHVTTGWSETWTHGTRNISPHAGTIPTHLTRKIPTHLTRKINSMLLSKRWRHMTRKKGTHHTRSGPRPENRSWFGHHDFRYRWFDLTSSVVNVVEFLHCGRQASEKCRENQDSRGKKNYFITGLIHSCKTALLKCPFPNTSRPFPNTSRHLSGTHTQARCWPRSDRDICRHWSGWISQPDSYDHQLTGFCAALHRGLRSRVGLFVTRLLRSGTNCLTC